jgi:Protein of unknown function (DUF664).
MDGKSALLEYLRARRADLLAKLDGLGEYDVRRPMTPTGTNLLGLVKHVSYVQLGYFGEVFGRPSGRSYPWDAEGAEEGVDLWAAPEETRADVLELYASAAAHADATIEELPLDATGTVPWWREERRHPTLHTVLVHVGGEVARHAGHADVLRELIDGSAGVGSPGDNLPERSAVEWAAFRERIEAAARQAAGLPAPSGAPPGDG